MITIERRLRQPRWLDVAVPLGSVAVAFLVMAVVLLATGHDPIDTYRRLFNAAFAAARLDGDDHARRRRCSSPGLAAAVAFRMNLFNIGAEGQLYLGAICASASRSGSGQTTWTTLTICRDVRLRRRPAARSGR